MKILVVGDVIIDRYTHGTRLGISAETPTIVANLTREETFVGGAGLVVRNLLRLGNTVTLVTPGRSELASLFLAGTDPITQVEASRLKVEPWELEGWSTTEKRRYFVEQYKLLQYDIVNQGKWKRRDHGYFVNHIKRVVPQYDAIVLCDNRHGTFTEELAKQIIQVCNTRKLKLPVYVDSQVSQRESNHHWYKGADFIFLNEIESDHVAKKIKIDSTKSQLEQISKFLRADIVYKRGEHGAILQSKFGIKSDPGFKVNAIDTCGAGDAFLASFVSNGDDLEKANRWAALSTTYKGTVVPKLQDLEKVKR